jgi:hypothetical protein
MGRAQLGKYREGELVRRHSGRWRLLDQLERDRRALVLVPGVKSYGRDRGGLKMLVDTGGGGERARLEHDDVHSLANTGGKGAISAKRRGVRLM